MFEAVLEILLNIFNGAVMYIGKFWKYFSMLLIVWVFYHFLVDGEIMIRTES